MVKTQVDFYDDLMDEPPETMELDGMVLIHKNKSKWHLCKKAGSSIVYACCSGRPTNPHETYYADRDENINEVHFKKAAEVVGPREALEQGRICGNCERILQDEFGLERMIIAVPDDVEPNATKEEMERFVRKLSNENVK